MKEMIIITISILAILAAANIKPESAKLNMGSVKISDITDSVSTPANISGLVELKSMKGDWSVSPSPPGNRAVFKSSIRLINFNDADGSGTLKTAKLR
jgi:hypothetical protein